MLKIFWLFSNTKVDFSNNFPKSYKNVLYIKFYFNRMLLTSTIYFVMKFLYWMSELWTCIAFILQFSPSKNTSWKYNWSLTLSWVSVLELSTNLREVSKALLGAFSKKKALVGAFFSGHCKFREGSLTALELSVCSLYDEWCRHITMLLRYHHSG